MYCRVLVYIRPGTENGRPFLAYGCVGRSLAGVNVAYGNILYANSQLHDRS